MIEAMLFLFDMENTAKLFSKSIGLYSLLFYYTIRRLNNILIKSKLTR